MIALFVALGLLIVAAAVYLAALLIVPRRYVDWMNRLDRSRGVVQEEEETSRQRLVRNRDRLATFERLAEEADFSRLYREARDALDDAFSTLDRVKARRQEYSSTRIASNELDSAATFQQVNQAIGQLGRNSILLAVARILERRLAKRLETAESKLQVLHEKPEALQQECQQFVDQVPALESILAEERQSKVNTEDWDRRLASIATQLSNVTPFLHLDTENLAQHVRQFRQNQDEFEVLREEVHQGVQQRKELDLRLDTLDKMIVWQSLSPLVQQIGSETWNASLVARQERQLPKATKFLDLLSALLKADAVMRELEAIEGLASDVKAVRQVREEFDQILKPLPRNVEPMLAQALSGLQACSARARSVIDAHKSEVNKLTKPATVAREKLQSTCQTLHGIAALRKEPLVLRYDQLLPTYDAAEGHPQALQEWTAQADALRRALEQAASDLRGEELEAQGAVSEMQRMGRQGRERAAAWACFKKQAANISEKAAAGETRLNSIRALDTIAEFEAAVRKIQQLRTEAKVEYERIETLHDLFQRLMNSVTTGSSRLSQTSLPQDTSTGDFVDVQFSFARQADNPNAAWQALTNCWTSVQSALQQQSLPVMVPLSQLVEPFSARVQLGSDLKLVFLTEPM